MTETKGEGGKAVLALLAFVLVRSRFIATFTSNNQCPSSANIIATLLGYLGYFTSVSLSSSSASKPDEGSRTG